MSMNDDADELPSETEPVATPNSEPLPNHVQDWLLVQLTNLANEFQLEFGITLNVGGNLVSGTMISGKTYLKEMADLIEAHTKSKPKDSQAFEQIMIDFFKNWIPYYDNQSENTENAFSRVPRYIHMRNAQTVMGGGTVVPSKGGILWRGRISAVDGFSFGSLNFG
jgi:hypothetical protein